MARAVPSSAAVVATLAALTWRRLSRGRALWVSAIIAALPVALASVMSSHDRGSLQDVMVFELLMLAVLPPMLVAASIGEEIEDRTTTYLWSRPVPRWTVLAGKLAALVPVAIVLQLGSLVLALLAAGVTPSLEGCAALVAAVVAVSLLAAALATLVPKHGMPLTICYMLFFDLPVGALQVSFSELSVTHQVRVLAGGFGEPGSTTAAIIALATVSVLWGGIAMLRIRKLEG